MNIILRVSNYISRYAPSKQKLSAYIIKKHYESRLEEILEEVGYNEDMMIEMWIRTFLNLGKSEREMRQKLQLKWFPKEKIFEKITQFEKEINDWENFENTLTKTIENKLKKGKSKMIIRAELVGKYPYFKEEIGQLFDKYSDKNGLAKEWEKYQKKYDYTDPKGKQKIYAALIRKGFRYDEIRRYWENSNNF